MTDQPARPNVSYGDRDLALKGEIIRSVVGSTVHGLAIDGQDDRDEMGVYIPTPEYVCGLANPETHVWRTQPEGARSGPGDVDLTIYELRHWMRLAVAGNPTIIVLFFAPDDALVVRTREGSRLRKLAPHVVSRQTGRKFLGYLNAQADRMDGKGKQNRVPNRPELIERHGYDCYLDDTEFLTRRGWLTYDEIADGEAVATVDQAAGCIEFHVPVERVSKPYTGPIVNIRHRYSECAVTPNHRMWVSKVDRGPSGVYGSSYTPGRARWGFVRADSLLRLQHHVRVAASPSGKIDYPVSDAYLTLVGAYVSEGSIAKRRQDGTASVIALDQNEGGRMEPMLATIGLAYPMRAFPYTREPDQWRSKPTNAVRYTIADRDVAGRLVEECGVGSRFIHLPNWAFDLSPRQAELLLDVLMAGDGTTFKRTGYRIYYSLSRRLAGDVQALAIIAGRRSNLWGPYEPKQMYQVLVQDPGTAIIPIKAGANVSISEVVDRRIVCFTVPNETLVTRRNGRVAMHGNTKYAGHALRLGLQGIELMRTGRLTLPMPEYDRARVLAVRRGEVSHDAAREQISDVAEELAALVYGRQSPLPDRPDLDTVNRYLIDAHRRAWDKPTMEKAITMRPAAPETRVVPVPVEWPMRERPMW